MHTSVVLTVALAAYLAASVLYIANLFVSGSRAAMAAVAVAGAGALAHTAGLFLIVSETGRGPYSTTYGAVAFVAWLVVLMQIGLTWRYRMHALGAVSIPIALLMLLYALALPPEMHQVLPGLRRQSLAAHISVTLLAYGAFAVAFGLAVIYLMESHLLKAKHLRGLFERLPPLRTTEELAARFAAFGHAMLTLGTIIGSVWAISDWDKGFWQDPKVGPTFLTWGIYTTYLVLRWGAGWRGRPAAYVLVVGFIAVLFTFFGINLLYPGLHGVTK